LAGSNRPRYSDMDSSAPIRVLLAKPGLDVHDRGIKIVARALRDAGMEVIYLGMRQTPEQIVSAAVSEDADVIGVSNLSAAHIFFSGRILELLRAEQAAEDILFVIGGTLSPRDIRTLKEMGVAACFTPGTDTRDIARFIEQNVKRGARNLAGVSDGKN
jgi:methylmalonyl-CoA mutase C-terminal domain/subunit